MFRGLLSESSFLCTFEYRYTEIKMEAEDCRIGQVVYQQYSGYPIKITAIHPPYVIGNNEDSKFHLDTICKYRIDAITMSRKKKDMTTKELKEEMIKRLYQVLSSRLPLLRQVECNEQGNPLASSYADACEERLVFMKSICETLREVTQDL